MEKVFKNLIGGVKLDKNGNIIGAKAILHGFFGKMNTTQALIDVHSITDAMGVYVSGPEVVINTLLCSPLCGSTDNGSIWIMVQVFDILAYTA